MKLHLVTGGCGFVGRNMVKHLKEKTSDFILIVDDLSTGLHPNNWLDPNFALHKTISIYEDKIIFIQEDLRTFCRNHSAYTAELKEIIKRDVAYKDVFHFAAVVGGRLKIEEEPLSVAIDLSIDAEFFNWAIKHKPKRVLYPSSSAAYPVTFQTRESHKALSESDISFTTIKNPDLTYGWAKLTGEYLAQLAAQKYGLHVTCIRPFSGYGADQDLTYPIPAIAQRFAKKENPIEVWGDGTQSRDFVYIDDVIDCTLRSMDVISDGSAINIGSGIQTSFLQIIETFAKISGHHVDVKTRIDKPVGVHHRYCSIEKVNKLTGWSPMIDLHNGLSKVYEKQLMAVKEG